MRRHITVAAVQMYIKPLDIDANLNKATALLEQIHKSGGCDLVVFPEDCITGPIPYNLNLASNEYSPLIEHFKELARKYKTHIVAGSFIEKVDDDYFNTSLLIDRNGKILLKYRKNNLWHPERTYLTHGSGAEVVKTTIGTIGIIICWDLAFPQLSNRLAAKGADIICCPSYWTVDDGKPLHQKYGNKTEEIMVNTLCSARAIENEALFIYANGAGIAEVPLKTTMFSSQQIGQSQICVPIYGKVKSMNDNSEGFVLHKYDRHFSKDAELSYKIRKDLVNNYPSGF